MYNRLNFIILSGTGQNVGKTTLACRLIERYKELKPIAIKITPHFHESDCRIFHKSENYSISIEENSLTEKDTSKMLAAGASMVYYVQTTDVFIPDVLNILLLEIPSQIPVICESGALRNYIKPGLFLMLSKTDATPKNIDLVQKADLLILNYKYPLEKLHFANGTWAMAY